MKFIEISYFDAFDMTTRFLKYNEIHDVSIERLHYCIYDNVVIRWRDFKIQTYCKKVDVDRWRSFMRTLDEENIHEVFYFNGISESERASLNQLWREMREEVDQSCKTAEKRD